MPSGALPPSSCIRGPEPGDQIVGWCGLARVRFRLAGRGRGLVAACFASLGVMLQRAGLGSDPVLADAATRAGALQTVILQYTVATLAAGIVAWVCIPDSSPEELERGRSSWPAIRIVLFGMRAVWLTAVIVTCAYAGYKEIDSFSGYAYEVLGMNKADAAGFTANASYIRLVAACNRSGGPVKGGCGRPIEMGLSGAPIDPCVGAIAACVEARSPPGPLCSIVSPGSGSQSRARVAGIRSDSCLP